MQTRTNTYKREVVSDDLDFEEYNKIRKFKKRYTRQICFGQNMEALYDKMKDEFKKNNERD